MVQSAEKAQGEGRPLGAPRGMPPRLPSSRSPTSSGGASRSPSRWAGSADARGSRLLVMGCPCLVRPAPRRRGLPSRGLVATLQRRPPTSSRRSTPFAIAFLRERRSPRAVLSRRRRGSSRRRGRLRCNATAGPLAVHPRQRKKPMGAYFYGRQRTAKLDNGCVKDATLASKAEWSISRPPRKFSRGSR